MSRDRVRRGPLAVALALALGAGCSGGEATEDAADADGFCEALDELYELADTASVGVDIDSSMDDAEIEATVERSERELQAVIDRGLALFEDLEREAPAKIEDAVSLVVADAREVYGAVAERADEPFAMIDIFEEFQPSPGFEDAIARIDAHAREECGTGFSLPLESIPPVPVDAVAPPGSPPAPPPVPSPPPPPPTPASEP